MSKVYDIYDRRNQDAIVERVLDDAIVNHIIGWTKEKIEKENDDFKLDLLDENGYSVRPLKEIESCVHSSSCNEPNVEHIQVDFNFADKSEVFDLHMEQHGGKRYLCIEFFGVEPGHSMERMFDTAGTEKCIEWCSNCGEEVVIDAVMYKDQMCPNCAEPIKACNLCSDCDRKCSTCSKES